MTLADLKNLPTEIKFVTLYNVVQTLVVTYLFVISFPHGWFLSILITIVLVLNYFLLKLKKKGWILALIWYILITFSFEIATNTAEFWFDISYGITFSFNLSFGQTSEFKIDVLALIVLFVHISSRKYFKKKTVIDEIDDIAGKSTPSH